jgi:hypothetical protein
MKNFVRLFVTITVLSGFVVSQLGQLSAQSNALAITPRKDYTLKPGESVTDTLSITNRDPQSPLQLELSVIDFSSQDESGTPELFKDSNTPKTAWSLRDYVTMPDQISIDANQTVRVPISIEMPVGIGAGSYYSAVQYRTLSETEENRLNVSASSVTLMFVKVPGQARQQLGFEQFGAFVPDQSSSGGSFKGLFFGERPKVLAYRLKNDGNIAEQPNASILVKNFSGEVVHTIADANPKDQLALRGQIRRFEACIVQENVQQTSEQGVEFDAIVCGDTNFKPGRYTAELTVLYGENGNETREINAKATFWYLPWWFVGLILACLAVIVGVVLYIVRRVQSYRSRRTRRR